jgi:hypothetical protein
VNTDMFKVGDRVTMRQVEVGRGRHRQTDTGTIEALSSTTGVAQVRRDGHRLASVVYARDLTHSGSRSSRCDSPAGKAMGLS